MTKKKILIIDDEASVTRMVKLSLEQTGAYEVRTENHARQGLAATREFKPDLILLDVMMPEMDGGEVAFQIQSDKLVKDIPIVFLTAIVSKKEMKAGEIANPSGRFLAKPVDLQELTKCIEECLA